MVKYIYFQYGWPEHKSSVAILRGWPKMCVCVCVYKPLPVWPSGVWEEPQWDTHRLCMEQQPTPPTLHHQISISLRFCCITHHPSPHYLAISACYFNPDMSYYCSFSLSKSGGILCKWMVPPQFVTIGWYESVLPLF